VIARQLLEAGTSIGANVDEARCAYSRRELAPRAELEPLRSEAREISAILAAIVKKARTPKEPGRT
jgi:hypothetical protein